MRSMRTRGHVAVLVACLLSVAIVGAQEIASVSPRGALLAGRVFDRDSQQPLVGVTVTLRSTDFDDVLKTTTDAHGVYVLDGIAPGNYYVTTFLDGYGSQDYGQSDEHNGRAQVISVAQGQTIRGVDVGVRRAGAVTGVVTTSDGRPVKDASVALVLTFDDRSIVLKG